ncbi:MAG: hypothetical protein AAFR49_09600, partial [Pseudomonadota bacterium]
RAKQARLGGKGVKISTKTGRLGRMYGTIAQIPRKALEYLQKWGLCPQANSAQTGVFEAFDLLAK